MPLQSGNVADSKHKQKTMLTSRIDMQTTSLLKDLTPDDFKTQMGKICKQQFKWFGWKKNSNVTKNILISIFQKRMKSRKKKHDTVFDYYFLLSGQCSTSWESGHSK